MAIQRNEEPQMSDTATIRTQSVLWKEPALLPRAVANSARLFTQGR